MKNRLVKSVMIATAIWGTVGCVEEYKPDQIEATDTKVQLPKNVQAALDAGLSIIDQDLTDTLSHMGNEERLAYDVYNAFYEKYNTKQFINIANNGEYLHITAVQALVQKYKLNDKKEDFTNVVNPLGYMKTPIEDMEAGTYDVPEIKALYDELIAEGDVNEIEALKVGCKIEVIDVDDLDTYIQLANSQDAPDIVTIFKFLRKGSYNHYWAFDEGLKKKGVQGGCCFEDGGVDYCKTIEEYPDTRGEEGGHTH